jgi:type VI secretion system secreted protein Hcp
MAFDGFIQFGDIEGESMDDKHRGWIEIQSCNMGILQNISTSDSSVGGATAERADFSDFRFNKLLDKASPRLSLACADGTHFPEIVIELCRAGTEKVRFMEINLSDAIISSITMDAMGDFPVETITLHYAKVQWRYTQQKREGGGAAGNVATGWDCQRNCKV